MSIRTWSTTDTDMHSGIEYTGRPGSVAEWSQTWQAKARDIDPEELERAEHWQPPAPHPSHALRF